MFIIASTIFALAQCNPSGSYCSVANWNGEFLTYPTLEACKAGADAQTRSYKAAGNNNYGKCVSRERSTDWKDEE